MESTKMKTVKQIFNEALERSESDRSGFVASACGDDGQILAEVETLLAAHHEAGRFLASPTMDTSNDHGHRNDPEVFVRLQRALAGRFSLERELGRGGMGIVYLARDVSLDRPVAIKLLPPALAAEPENRERFLREARTAAGLSHPNIVPIHLVGETDGLVYFVMSFVDGESLGDRVRRAGPLKPADAAKLVQEVAWALAYAHSQGVIHRDIKPDNILIDSGSGRALVTDFGIARVTSTGTMSQQGEVLGTLQYMSPEQASPEGTIDGRADLYSLGVTAFFALSGRLPFESDNPMALIAMHITEPAPPLRSVITTLPARLAEAIDRCLAKDPAARFRNGEALAEAIADAQVTRRDVAPSVREFLSVARGSAGELAMLAMLGTLFYAAAVGTWTGRPVGGVEGVLVLFGAAAIFVVVRLFDSARGVVRAGLDQGDVAQAVAASATARDANVEYQLGQVQRLGNWLSAPVGRAALILINSAGAWAFVDWIRSDLQHLSLLDMIPWLFWVGVWGAFSVLLIIAPKRATAAVTRGTPESAGLWRRLWAGPIGRWCFKLAGIGLKKGKALPVPESAPTEILLGRAAGELFEKLPEAQRARLGEIREVIGGLERAATALRTRRDELVTAIADVGEPQGDARRGELVRELDASRVAAEQRLAKAVSALENLRLDLLRLGAGVGHPDDLTVAIEEARAVGQTVKAEIEARHEIDLLASPST